MQTTKILLLDNYDSFTYNIHHMVKALGYTNIEVHRNDQITLDAVEAFDKIILSPGPGIPSEAGILLDVIRRYAATKSILGVCLGHQAIGEVFGATLVNLSKVYHGVAMPLYVLSEDTLFNGMPKQFEVGRYHSWAVSGDAFPDCLEITAVDELGAIMALRHRIFNVEGIQFHPESVLTPRGEAIIKNWLEASPQHVNDTK